MLLLALSKKLNRRLGPFLLKHGVRLRFALGGGVIRDSPVLDALLLLPWSMRVVSLEVHEEIKQQSIGIGGGEAASNKTKGEGGTNDADDSSDWRVAVLERYVRPALLPNERWSDARQWQFHSHIVKWVRGEYLWAKFGPHVQSALLAYSQLRDAPQMQPTRSGQREHLFSPLPSTELLVGALNLHDWTDRRKDWAATGRAMTAAAKKLGGKSRVIEVPGRIRFADVDPDTDTSNVPLTDVLELVGAYVADSGPLNALCEKRGIYQVWTREYVEKLGRYLLNRTQSYDGDTVVLDVGAGDGLLAHFLRQYFQDETESSNRNHRGKAAGRDGSRPARTRRRKPGKVPTIIATDDGSWRISPVAPVESRSAEDAIKYFSRDGVQQVIVICSWMPMGEDWSHGFRQGGVHEYILIGEADDGQCGENWTTWGNFTFQRGIEEELASAMSTGEEDRAATNGSDDDDQGRELRPYEADGYVRKDLDAFAPYQWSRFDSKLSKAGKTVSFRKKGG